MHTSSPLPLSKTCAKNAATKQTFKEQVVSLFKSLDIYKKEKNTNKRKFPNSFHKSSKITLI